MSQRNSFHAPFLVAVALIAAAAGDPLVETISNSGIFGSGFGDHNHRSVLPTLLGGIALVLEFACLRAFDVWRASRGGTQPGRFRDLARALAKHASARDVPAIFALQLAAVFAMESAEQLAFDGTLHAGLGWLGGPIAFSLATHLAICVVATIACAAAVRRLAHAFATLARAAIDFFYVARDRAMPAAFSRRTLGVTARCTGDPLVRHAGGRAPPQPALA